MQTVTSRDGTRIAFWRSGGGPALLLVHGATADHTTTWRFVLAEFERRFTVYAMDRRGRGGSGDSPAYELQREVEDVTAVVDSIGEPVNVLGHSYGGLCAIEAALLTANLRQLILYEGVPLRGADLYRPGVADRLEALLQAGDAEGMLVAMYREVVEMPPEEVELLRSQRDAWAVRLANAPTMPRELRGEQGYTFEPGRFRNMRTPTLLLVGGDSPRRELDNAKGVADALPDARVVILPGQQHAAMLIPLVDGRELRPRSIDGSSRSGKAAAVNVSVQESHQREVTSLCGVGPISLDSGVSPSERSGRLRRPELADLPDDLWEDATVVKISQALPDHDGAKHPQIRVVDESGEDYLYRRITSRRLTCRMPFEER